MIAILEIASSKIDRFGWTAMDETIKGAILADWCDRLSKYQLQEVRDAVAALFTISNGRLRSLNEFQVEEHIRIEHRRQLALLPKMPELSLTGHRQPPTPEERARVAAIVAWFSAKKFGGKT